MDYRHLGRRRTLAIGRYPDVSLIASRLRRDEARKQLADGRDPVDQKRLKRMAAITAGENTFKTISQEWIEKRRNEGASARTITKITWLVGLACESFGSRPIADITAAEVLLALKKLEKRGKYDSAANMRAICGRVFRYAVASARAERDVAADLRDALTRGVLVHRAALFDPVKIGGLMRSIDGYDGYFATRQALRLLPRVFCRPGELRFADWEEFSDLEKPEPFWRIPSERMKMKRDHIVPLSTQSIQILVELRRASQGTGLLFPSVRSARRPMSDNTLNAAFRGMGYGPDEVTAHGLRRTASTILNEQDQFESDWIERQLAHLEANAVRGAYNAAEWLPQRRQMMQWWSDYLDRLAGTAELLG
jgi:integrase